MRGYLVTAEEVVGQNPSPSVARQPVEAPALPMLRKLSGTEFIASMLLYSVSAGHGVDTR